MGFRGPKAHPNRVEKPRLLFALCSRFIRLGGFFVKFRGRNAHPNRPQKAMVCPTYCLTGQEACPTSGLVAERRQHARVGAHFHCGSPAVVVVLIPLGFQSRTCADQQRDHLVVAFLSGVLRGVSPSV